MVEKLGIYKVSVTAKAETPRLITVKVGADGNGGWSAYSQEDVQLSPEMATYEYEFTMYGETNPNARFEIWFAQDMAPVWIEHVALERIGTAEQQVTMEELLAREKTEADEDLVEDWQLVWSDEFDGSEIDMNNWTFEVGNGADKGIPGWGNNELEYYTDSSDNAFIDNGNLVIQALEEEKNFTVDGVDYTTDYTSARMITQDKVTVAYGRIEARVKVPSGQGIWPAFWMLGQDITTVGWPDCGEIDILEYIGSNVTEVHGTPHGPISAGPGINGHVDTGINLSEDYHLYALEWDEDELEFYVDDILYHIVNKDEVDLEVGPDEWVYDHEYYMILNLAVGGNWPGSPDETTTFPKQLIVDYIRIYEDVNPASIDGEEVIDSIYEMPETTPGIEGFANGDFADGSEGWTSYIHYDAAGTFSVVNEEAVFSLSNDGEEDYSAHMYQGPFLFEGDKTYELTFDARADVARDLLVVIDNAGYYRFVDEMVALGSEMTNYSLTFGGIDEEATLKFLVGELGNAIVGDNNIYIDNVVVQEAGTPPVTQDPGYIYDFDNNLIVEGGFGIWEQDEWSGPGAGTLIQENGLITVDVTGVGNAYSPQVFQDGMTFDNGATYMVSFTASASASKTINVNVGKGLDADPWWLAYAPTQTCVIEETKAAYSYMFEMTQETFDNGKIVFELGTVNGDATTAVVSIDNINVVKLDSVLTDSWNIWEQDEWSGPGAGTMTYADSVLTVDVTGVGNAYSPQVYQDGITFTQGNDYLVMFEASALDTKTINVNIGQALSADPWWQAFAPTETLVIDTAKSLYVYEFTMTEATYDNGKMVFELGTINGDATITTLAIEDIRIIENARLNN